MGCNSSHIQTALVSTPGAVVSLHDSAGERPIPIINARPVSIVVASCNSSHIQTALVSTPGTVVSLHDSAAERPIHIINACPVAIAVSRYCFVYF